MNYYSTNHQAQRVGLKNAVLKGLAPDNGLYMPEEIPVLSSGFFKNLPDMSLPEIGMEVAKAFFGEDIPKKELKEIVEGTLNFEIPLVPIGDNIYSLELFHGPTCAFKDVGGRFMARLLSHFTKERTEDIHVLTATSGDTGSAIASGFFQVEGIKVVILYPKGKVSHIQEQQLTTYGGNITAIEVDGNFDDCQKMVKKAFLDPELNTRMTLTSANSINIARFMPQSFYYFHAVAQLKNKAKEIVFSVPSGNFGNLTGGLFAKKMGLPIKKFIAATNVNDIVPNYLVDGNYNPRPSIRTIANAMDVGDPSNFARMLAIYGGSHKKMAEDIFGFKLDDDGIRQAMKEIYQKHQYIADPHGAIGYQALKEMLLPGETGIFLETAHPAKFIDVVEPVLGKKIEIPERLSKLLDKEKKAIHISSEYIDFKAFMLDKIN